MKLKLLFSLLIFLSQFQSLHAQPVFWSEDFNNGCTSNCLAGNYTGPNGLWTVASTGTNGNVANEFFISCAENGQPVGSCGAGCGNNATLHVGSVPCGLCITCPNGDCGAAYNAGPTFLGDNPVTNKRAESPLISTVGKSNITLEFSYIEEGQAATDDATVVYSIDGGANWSLLANMPKTNNGLCGGQGYWTAYAIQLPAVCENIPDLKIGFTWKNNADGVGTDPSFAVDEVELAAPANQPPVAAFSSDLQIICINNCINFSDLSAGNPTSWQWIFQNANPSTSMVQNPTNICFNQAGLFDVTLIVSNAFGSDTLTQTAYISVSACSPPTANFTASATNICDSTCIDFNDLSGFNPTSYLWIFPGGNPTISNAPNPVNICYNNPGTYDVTLVVENTYGSDTLTFLNYINVVACTLPVADFTSQTNFCDSTCIDFTDNSSGGPTSWKWYFQGAIPAISNVQNPTGICYNNSGVFNVTLVTTNSFGTDSLVKTGWITVNSCFLPQAAFTVNDSVLCEKECVDFFDLTTNSPTSWNWTFSGATPDTSTLQNPAGICYNQYGIYPVTLTVSNSLGGDSLTILSFITVNPDPPAPVITAFGVILNSTPANGYQWYLNNQIINGAINQVYQASQPGDYFVIITDSNGCQAASNLISVTNTLLNEISNLDNLNIYPNPSGDFIFIKINDFFETQQIHCNVMNVIGENVISLHFAGANQSERINIEELSKGIYFVEIIAGEKRKYFNFVKK